MEKINVKYSELIRQMLACSRPPLPLLPATVYRKANLRIRPFIDQMIEESLIEPSALHGLENLTELAAKARAGSSCLLLMEHYSNFDLPALSWLLRKNGETGQQIDDAIIAVAGMKLDVECPVVAAFAEAYRRIIISPRRTSRTQTHTTQSLAINLAAAKKIREEKKKGNLILMFPSGTRYRLGDPSTRQGQRETDTYIKSFDYMCLISINGNILRVQEEGGMAEDFICRDQMTLCAGPVIDCPAFRETVRRQPHLGVDKKQAVADEVMRWLAEMHDQISCPDSIQTSAR